MDEDRLTRIEQKLDRLHDRFDEFLQALADEEVAEDAPAGTTLDGEPAGGERDTTLPLG